MGGEAGVQSQPGQGSRFWIRCPFALVASGQESRRAARLPAATPADELACANSLHGKVLAVEDDAVNREVIAALLPELGLTVEFAHDGQQAVAALHQGALVDLILMDIQMPVMNGYEATRHIRQWERETGRSRQPIIALTANAFDEDRQKCHAAGMDDFLVKPISSLALLAAKLRQWLPARAESVPVAATHEAELAINVPRLLAIWQVLAPLLLQHKFSAVAHFNELQAALVGTADAQALTAAKHLLDELQFVQAHNLVLQWLMDRGWLNQPPADAPGRRIP